MRMEKLTEATILALQGKLEEAENKDNRKLNLMIRNATKYVNELEKAGFDVLVCRMVVYERGQSVLIDEIKTYSPENFAELDAKAKVPSDENVIADDAEYQTSVWVTKSGMNKFYDVTSNVYGEADDLDSEYAELEYSYKLDNSNFDIANFLATPSNEDQYAQDELAFNDSTYDAIKYHKKSIANTEQRIKDIEKQIDELHSSNADFKNDEELQKLYAELEKLSKEQVDGFSAKEYARLKDKIKSRYNK